MKLGIRMESKVKIKKEKELINLLLLEKFLSFVLLTKSLPMKKKTKKTEILLLSPRLPNKKRRKKKKKKNLINSLVKKSKFKNPNLHTKKPLMLEKPRRLLRN
jgi:hypothetical protein